MKYKIITPVVTAFDEDLNVDYKANEEIIEYLISNGVDGIAPLGSTGEFPDISLDLKKDFIKFYLDKVNSRVEVIVGTGGMNFKETVELSNYALELGADGVLIIPPYYFGMSDEEAFRYYDRLASQVDGNIYIYNFKARSGYDMSPKTLVSLLKKHKNIVGMKDSTNSFEHTRSCLREALKVRKDFIMYSGFDNHFIPNVLAGGSGCIAALSNLVPKKWSNWIKAVENEDVKEIRRISEEIDNLMELYKFKSNFAVIFKELMKTNGLPMESYSLFPFDLLPEEDLLKAKSILNKNLGG